MVVSGPGVIRADRRKPTPRAEASFMPSIPGARNHHRKPRILTREVRPSSGCLFITFTGSARAFATNTHIVRVYPRRAARATSRNKCEARISVRARLVGTPGRVNRYPNRREHHASTDINMSYERRNIPVTGLACPTRRYMGGGRHTRPENSRSPCGAHA